MDALQGVNPHLVFPENHIVVPAEQLARLGHEENLSELKALVATVSKFLEIQRLGLASIDILSERELSQLDFLVATAVSCLLMLLLAIP